MIRTKKFLVHALGLLAAAGAARAGAANFPPLTEAEIARLPHVVERLVPPPGVPHHHQVDRHGFRVIEARLVVHEKLMPIDQQGTQAWFFTYNGSVPGPLIVAHAGDYLQITLVNPSTNTFEHNIDFHASTGAMGGGDLTKVQPGQEVTLRFRVTRPGVFVYHCAPGGIMVPWHVTHGMNGCVLVLPRGGLDDGHGKALHYDRAYYIGEQDYYLAKNPDGTYKRYRSPAESMGDDLVQMATDNPAFDVFEGRVGALTGGRALTARVGETVLIIHSSANRDTRPHLIGGQGDYVWERGKFSNPPQVDQETWFIAGGSAGAALVTFRQPGTYAYLNHDLIDAMLKGAVAQFKVTGAWNDDLMKLIRPAGPIAPK